MDDIMKTDVDEEQIEPYMKEIDRQFEYIDKEDIIKKMVTITFGRFLDYYKNAPQILKPSSKRNERSERAERGVSGNRRPRKAEAGFRRLFINLGKQDGFYPGEIMQFMNHHIHGRQEVGHIDLLQRFSYIEVPKADADKVMRALNGISYKGREVRCNDADEGGRGRDSRSTRSSSRNNENGGRRNRVASSPRGKRNFNDDEQRRGKDDWKSLMQGKPFKFKGDEPDFSEEGWARRRPKKKK
jgi:DEAD/DEAH box family ATP-dependent RNA helicase